MSSVQRTPPDCEVRSVIKFLYKEGVKGREIYRRLCRVYGENNVMSLRAVYQWIDMFRNGREEVHDEQREGRPSEAVNEETVNIIRTLLEENRRYTVSDLHQKMATQYAYVDCSRTSIYRILSEELEMTKVCARWVPRALTEAHRTQRMGAALDFLTRYQARGDKFLDQLVTGDETWVHYWTPETKRASMVWKTATEPAPKKFKTVPSSGKVMATLFWDREGPLLLEYMQKGSTITQQTYFDTILRLRDAIKRKRPGKLRRGIVLLHDNARPHTAALMQWLYTDLQWDVFGHPAHSPDLAPSDFHAFPGLKSWLGGRRFASDEELKNAVEEYFRNLDESWYSAGIEKLISRYNKCLDTNGDYVEK